jgi:hypothetical protein
MPLDPIVDNVLKSVIDGLKQQSKISLYRENPALWAKDVLGVDLWSKQQDVLQSLVENDHVAVRSAHGTGKSELASIIACWWVATRPIGDAIVMVTAPTYSQIHSIIFEYIRKHHAKAKERYESGLSPMKLPGYVTQGDAWKSDDGILMAQGRKPADSDTGNHGFQGIHRRYVLVIVDESCGIKEGLFTAVEAVTTTEGSLILAIGNPDDPATQFNKFFTKDENWARVDISSFDSPNFTKDHEGHYKGCDDKNCLERQWALRYDRDRNIPKDILPLLPNKEWVDQRRVAWGEDSPLWASKVLGQFPLQSVNALFSRDTLNRGHDTTVKPLSSAKVILGVDLSRFGPNYSTIYKYEFGNGIDPETGKPSGRSGGRLRLIDKWGGKADETEVDGMESAARVHQWAQSLGATEVRIDSEGVGGPILDRITALSEGSYTVIAMRGSQPSPDAGRWVNARSYWYDSIRERMFNREIDIDPDDTNLEEELEQIQYHFKNRYSSLQIEAKEDMERRGIPSPDFSDAAVYAAADLSYLENNPIAKFKPGDKISMTVEDFLGMGNFTISPY